MFTVRPNGPVVNPLFRDLACLFFGKAYGRKGDRMGLSELLPRTLLGAPDPFIASRGFKHPFPYTLYPTPSRTR